MLNGQTVEFKLVLARKGRAEYGAIGPRIVASGAILVGAYTVWPAAVEVNIT